MKPAFYLLLLVIFLTFNCSSNNEPVDKEDTQIPENLYFPSLGSNDDWEEIAPADLNWNTNAKQPLLDFLEEKNTKGFIVLYNGRIALEAYFNNHTDAKLWYWASAGKTLTSTITGIAQDEGLIDINNKVSDYLGVGWTSSNLEKENLITCKNLLSMNSGLDDSLGDNVSTENLQYLADAGTRWAYHNAYVKMQDVISEASNGTWNDYFNSKLRNKIGMTGAWINLGDFKIYGSNTLSMARFGLLIYANGNWNDTQIVSESFLNEATNTSQDINKSYGYLWWLNGKSSYHLPQSQVEFNDELIPNAPSDMYAALGKNDQKIYIIPSKKLVIVRVGDTADSGSFALSNFDNELWEKINAFID